MGFASNNFYCATSVYHLTAIAQILEHECNEKHDELVVMMTRIRGRCFSFFFALVETGRAQPINHDRNPL